MTKRQVASFNLHGANRAGETVRMLFEKSSIAFKTSTMAWATPPAGVI